MGLIGLLEYIKMVFSGVAYGNSTFVAVGSGGTILTSTDGTTWTPRTSGTNGTFSEVIYGNSIFMAVSGGTVFTSPDGATWTVQTYFSSNALWGQSPTQTVPTLQWVHSGTILHLLRWNHME